MNDVVVIGGGLSGLAAAYELEQQHIPYTLIEVKGRLGGSIVSESLAGFVLDGGPFVLYKSRDWPWLDELGLVDALYHIADLPRGGQLVAFKSGTQTLVDALVGKLQTGHILPRMAVSTLGKIDEQYAVCLENGMVQHGAALIVAAPARFTERMFYTFVPEISQALLNFHYDTVTRVTLGYRQGEVNLPTPPPPDNGFIFEHWTDDESRVLPGHVLVQVGIRFPLAKTTPEALITEVQQNLGWSWNHVLSRVDWWPESHCLHEHHDEHAQIMQTIETQLPAGVVLAGSDYYGIQLEDRIDRGRNAAQQIAAFIRNQ